MTTTTYLQSDCGACGAPLSMVLTARWPEGSSFSEQPMDAVAEIPVWVRDDKRAATCTNCLRPFRFRFVYAND